MNEPASTPVNLDRVAEILRNDYGMTDVQLEPTGGGIINLYVGPIVRESNIGPIYTAVVGPGRYDDEEGAAVADTASMFVGPDNTLDDADPLPDAIVNRVWAPGTTPEEVAALLVQFSTECDGCNAEVGEPCRDGCLSYVTDDKGQPTDDDAPAFPTPLPTDPTALGRIIFTVFEGENGEANGRDLYDAYLVQVGNTDATQEAWHVALGHYDVLVGQRFEHDAYRAEVADETEEGRPGTY